MKTLTIGNQQVTRVGLGCMGMSDFYGPADDQQSIDVIRHALDVGVNMLDTADMYGPWRNEQLLGKAIKGKRDQAFVATKFGVMRDESGAFLGINGSPEYVRKACDDSLKRLGVEHIDLYYQHRVDPNTPIEDTVGAMKDLVKAGKVKYIGLSEAHPDTIRRAQSVHPISALQTEYSLWTRDPEQAHIPLCKELGIAFVAYSPLGRGFLSGGIQSTENLDPNDYRRSAPRFSGDNFAQNKQLVDAMAERASAYGCTTAQLALAWLFAQAGHVMAIPGTTKRHRIDENLAALSVNLSHSDVVALNELAPLGAAAGTRYDERGMTTVNR
ncbi:MAG: aldo/keto reductase [Acidobacteria bacterium]|nr:aldo/keto reductase [Acidobacteriota bacterium]